MCAIPFSRKYLEANKSFFSRFSHFFFRCLAEEGNSKEKLTFILVSHILSCNCRQDTNKNLSLFATISFNGNAQISYSRSINIILSYDISSWKST
jgi:hypothetical protein